MAIDFLYQVECNADRNQQSGTTIEAGYHVIDSHQFRNDGWDDSDQCQERSSDVRDSLDDVFEVIFGTSSRSVTRDEGTVVLHVVGDFFGVKSNRSPEVTEEVNHPDVHQGINH